MLKKTKLLSVTIPVLMSSIAYSATPQEQSRFQLLSDSRQYIQLPSYNNDEKQTIADQAEKLLSIYVNRENKKMLYGNDLDAIPRIKNIQQNAVSMSDSELHNSIQDVFKSQRDLHLNYNYPRPYSCFAASQMFSLKEVYSPTRERKAVIDGVLSFLEPLAPQIANLSVGDEIVKIDGGSLKNTIQSLVNEGAGANTFGSFNRALSVLTFRSFRADRVPSANNVSYTFKRAADGSLYEINIPWITVGNAECIESATTTVPNSVASSDNSETNLNAFGLFNEKSEDLFQQEYNAHFGRSVESTLANSGVTINSTADSTIDWGIINNRYGRFGYLSLSSMVPDSGPLGGVQIISELLTNELADTDGLILDVRNNGGGFVIYAEILPQLFSAQNVQPYVKRAVKADLNELIFVDLGAEGEDWKQAYQEIKDTDKNYTKPLELTPTYFANEFVGQVYFKPVAVLTNAACYSACDLISGLMQDFSDATLWGEDLLTGAGGANVIGFNSTLINGFMLDQVPGSGIKPLPGFQDMRVAWRQTIRTGESENRVIEDLGVSVDRRARPTISDVQGTTQTQFDRISSDLKYKKWEKRSSVSFLESSSLTDVEFIAQTGKIFFGYEIGLDFSQGPKTKVKVVNTDRVNVYINGEKVSSVYTYGGGNSGKEIEIELPGDLSPASSHLLKLEGVNYGDVVWRVNRLIKAR